MAGYDQADLFLIPLLDGTFALGQVAQIGGMPLGTVLCHLSFRKGQRDQSASPLVTSEVAAVLLIDDDRLTDGTWPIIGFEAIQRLHPPSVDTVQDPAVAEALANALHGLYPWDGFPDPAFFDGLLMAGVARPDAARIKSAF